MIFRTFARYALTLTGIVFSLSGCGAAADADTHADSDDSGVSSAAEALGASACGSGYKLVGAIPLEDVKTGKPSNPSRGELEVFYNASTGDNCLVNQALGPLYGVPKGMSVRVCLYPLEDKRCDNAPADWSLSFKYYAGPIHIKAPHTCINYLAAIYHDSGVWGVSGRGFCG